MWVCNCVCYEPIELYVSIYVSVLPLQGTNHWSTERTTKYVRIRMRLSLLRDDTLVCCVALLFFRACLKVFSHIS